MYISSIIIIWEVAFRNAFDAGSEGKDKWFETRDIPEFSHYYDVHSDRLLG